MLVMLHALALVFVKGSYEYGYYGRWERWMHHPTTTQHIEHLLLFLAVAFLVFTIVQSPSRRP